MRILAPTYVDPNTHHIRTRMFNNIFSSLRSKTTLDVVWVIFQPDIYAQSKIQDGSMIDIHDFDDAVSLLKEANPDCILITSTLDVMQLAFSIAARHLNIKIFSVHVYDKSIVDAGQDTRRTSLMSGISKFLSNKTSTDTTTQQKFFRRGRYIMYKNKFLFNTMRNARINPFRSNIIICQTIANLVSGNSKNYNELADYHILPDDSWIPFLTSIGVLRENIFVTGNTYWETSDDMTGLTIKECNSQDRIKILIVTDALVEHGLWSKKHRASFIGDLISALQEDPKIMFSFKIHPASEDRRFYTEFLQDYPSNTTRIYQKGRIYDVIPGFDLAVSFGRTTAHTEIIASGTRLIMIDPILPYLQLVEKGISSGLVEVYKSTDNMAGVVRAFVNKKITISEDLAMECARIFANADESSKKIADIIISKVST